jgi:hypothetical protein
MDITQLRMIIQTLICRPNLKVMLQQYFDGIIFSKCWKTTF